MVDTLILHFYISLPFIKKSPRWTNNTGKRASVLQYQYYSGAIDCLHSKVKLKYYPKSKHSDLPVLVAEFGSIPKLKSGNNYEMVFSIDQIIEVANFYLRSVKGLEHLDAAYGILDRIDFCFNFQVGPNVEAYLKALSKVTCTSRNVSWFANRLRFPNTLDKKVKGSVINGVLVACQSKSTTFYDKYKECLNECAKGILRMETRVKGNNVIGKTIGINKPRLKDITLDICQKVLVNELDFLGISGEYLSETNVLEQLIDKFEGVEGVKLNGHIQALNLYPGKSVKELETLLKVKKNTIYAWRKGLTEKGISLGMSSSRTILPRLVVDFSAEISKNHKKFICDTGEAVTPYTSQELEFLESKRKSILSGLSDDGTDNHLRNKINNYLEALRKSQGIEEVQPEPTFSYVDKNGNCLLSETTNAPLMPRWLVDTLAIHENTYESASDLAVWRVPDTVIGNWSNNMCGEFTGLEINVPQGWSFSTQINSSVSDNFDPLMVEVGSDVDLRFGRPRIENPFLAPIDLFNSNRHYWVVGNSEVNQTREGVI